MRKPFVFALLALTLALPALAVGPEDIRRAAEAGDAEMQLELGVLYEYGFGLPQNTVPALAWYTLAAEQGHAKAALRRDALKGRMQSAEIEEAERLLNQWRAEWAKRPASTAPASAMSPESRSTTPAAPPSNAFPAP